MYVCACVCMYCMYVLCVYRLCYFIYVYVCYVMLYVCYMCVGIKIEKILLYLPLKFCLCS